MLSTCQSAALFAESRRLVEQNRKLLRQSLQRMAHGRRHLHPRFAVSGGSDNASERTLGAMVRELLASGRLRPIDGKVLSGQGSGKPCVVCGEVVMPTELQLEPETARIGVAHATCFLAWYEVSNTVDGAGVPGELDGNGSPA